MTLINIHDANYVVLKRAQQIVEQQEKSLREKYPDATIHMPVPVVHFFEYQDCFDFLCMMDPSNAHIYYDDAGIIAYNGDEEIPEPLEVRRVRHIADEFNIDLTKIETYRFDEDMVVAAANRYGDLIFVGARHGGPAMWNMMKAVREDRLIEYDVQGKAEQGFINQRDEFLTREEAMALMKRNGQLNLTRLRWPAYGDDIFSENRY